MTHLQKRRLRSFLAVWIFALFSSTLLQKDRSVSNLVTNGAISLALTFVIAAVQIRLLPRLRGASLVKTVALSGLAYLVALVFSVLVSGWALMALEARALYTPRMKEVATGVFLTREGQEGLAYSYCFILFVTFSVELVRRIGPGRILNWLSGRYRNPKEERRVFLFIDLSGSTPLAEALGSVRFSAFLRDFFHGLTEPVDETDGEIVSYVGDEAIISWPETKGLERAAALRCFLLFREKMEAEASHFVKEYGEAPRYKAAIHLGPVVATEVGQRRTDLVLHGDALNTTARILGECGSLGADLLISEATAQRFPAVLGVRMEPVGAVALRGKGEPLPLVKAVVG
ncbi:adenylate/guanylate cyclase domain-containing protein [bacterium]|nr:MAG: adenylate/guanylate cyclase domain-containing protein [bacterium]